MTRFLVASLAALISLSVTHAAQAKECEGVRMPNRVQVEGASLALNGMGIREATVFKVNVYVAGLYVTEKSRNGKAIAGSESAKRLVLHFMRDVEKSKMTDAFKDGFKKTAGGGFKAELAKLGRFIGDMKEGQELSFTYVPDRGLEVRVGNRKKGVIEGAAFAKAFFEIWLGSSPPNSGLKKGLLGGKCG